MKSNSTNNDLQPEENPPDDGLLPVIEALTFAAEEPVPPEDIARIYAEVTGSVQPPVEDVVEAVERLQDKYKGAEHALRIEKWGGGYRMATSSEWAPYVKTMLAESARTGLSRSLMETLAILAYRQPVTRPEVDFIRGVSADYAIRKLLDLGLVDVIGRSDSLGRPLLYGTTQRFLEEFGLDSLDDLPTLREIEELLDDPHFNAERAQLLTLKQEETVDHPRLSEITEAEEEPRTASQNGTSKDMSD